MESLPPRQASQPRPSPPEQPSSNPTQAPVAPSPVRTRSEDSQTLFLNSPKQEQQAEHESHAEAQPADKDADASVKKCWICFSDSTEDTPETSPWRDPCPCALVAHEECLLDWIADMEAPNNRRSHSVSAPKIECPQCKSEIRLARPRNLVVEAVRGIERAGTQLITPGALTVLVGTVYHSSMAWGVHSIYAIFGADDGFRILRPLLLNAVRPPLEFENATAREIGERMLGIAVDHIVHWRLYVGLPLITPMLVLSRTKLADSILPVLPILFFATQNHSPHESLDFGQWPPSASLAFAVLPYIRSAYNIYYQKVWAERAKRWLKEIQPRVREGQTDGAGNAADANEEEPVAQDRDDGNIFEVRIDGGILAEWDEEDDEDEDENEEIVQAQQAAEAPPMEFQAAREQEEFEQQEEEANAAQPPPDIADDRAPQQQNQNAQNGPPPNPAPAERAERRLSFSPTAIAETVLGALVFPAIAGMSGELLKLALPRSWTTPSSGAGSSSVRARVATKGLLQEKWGRSLVGGCLFVVLKDAVMLYVRWKMVQMHRKRRVLDYDRKKDKGRAEGEAAG